MDDLLHSIFSWRGRDPALVLAIVLDAVLRMLALEFIYTRVNDASGTLRVEVARSAGGTPGSTDEDQICKAIRPLLESHDCVAGNVIDNPVGTGKVFLSYVRLGSGNDLGTVVVASKHSAFPTDLLLNVASNAAAMELREGQVRADRMRLQEVEPTKLPLHAGSLLLRNEIRIKQRSEEIVGHSKVLRRTLKLVERVAPTDACVLILGETGTGKELIARAVHRLSSRRDRAFVKMDCASIPTGLIESELFGHEKGAFTGAVARKQGRFELADGGTMFLDEVGEIPLEQQSKLLRILQEQEFEHLGSARTLHVNVRIVAATNRDLKQMVADQNFRSDLYYRLSVFPVTMPALRERCEDIPALARHFVARHSARMNRPAPGVSASTLVALQEYGWPGNVRELENFIERSVILTQGPVLEAPVGELHISLRRVSAGSSLCEMERRHISEALEASNWVLGGPSGAAAKLGMKRTSLQYRMQKLGLARPS